jgi:hypothetical protein
MAEAAASIIAFIELSGKIVGYCRYYVESFRDAPEDIRSIMIEISFLQSLLENIKFLTELDSQGSIPSKLSQLLSHDGPLRACHRALVNLEQLFPSDAQPVNGNKRQKIATKARLAWPFKSNRAKALLEEISGYKSSIVVAIATDTA